MNVVYYIVLNAALLCVTINEASIIELLLQRKHKITNSLEFCRKHVQIEETLKMSPTLREQFCADFLLPTVDELFPIVSKKSPKSQCKCNWELDDKYLGHEYYPSNIPQRKCLQTACCQPPLNCREIQYPVKVLRVRGADEDEDKNVPSPLNHCWTFQIVNVTAACHCSL